MRKSTLFLSVVLTTFMLAVLFGVASAYQRMAKITQTKPVAQLDQAPVSEVQSVQPAQSGDPLISMAPSSVISPEQAAALAAQMLGHNDVYSVESTTYEGATAYLVTFSSGDLVYVSPTGQILATTKPQPVVVTVNKPQREHSGGGGGGGAGGGSTPSGGGEHEQEHEQESGD